MDLLFVENATQQQFQVITTHIPRDPNQLGKKGFARYVLSHMRPDYAVIALGDMNFTETEMQMAFDEEADKLEMVSSFKNLTNYNTNISPFVYTSKNIDHIWVHTSLKAQVMLPDEILPGLQLTVDLLHPEYNTYADMQAIQGLEAIKKRNYRPFA